MNDLDRIRESIDDVLEWAKKGAEYVSVETPKIVKEIVSYHFWYAIACLLFWNIVCNIIGFGTLYLLNNWKPEVDGDDAIKHLLMASFYLFLIATNIISIAVNGAELIKIYFAPRVYVIEYLMRLISRNC